MPADSSPPFLRASTLLPVGSRTAFSARRVLGACLLPLSLIALACGGADEDQGGRVGGGNGPATGAPSQRAPSALTVEAVRLEPRRLDEVIDATGELLADESIELKSEVGGRIVALRFVEGERVRRGEPMVQLDDSNLRAELRRAEAQRGIAARREARLRRLVDEGTISQSVYDEAAGELAVLDADIGLIQARLEKMTLAAPFSGVVGLRGVSEGSVVTSQTPIVTLQKLDPIKLDFAIPERYAGFARPGTRVEFEVAGSAETFVGDIYAVEPAVEAATRSVRVRARAANPEGRLLPGAFAEVQWTLAERPSALLVPSIAVLSDLDASSVLLAVEGVVERRRVELGRRTDDFVEVTSGLERGDAVILTGLQQLRPGDPVTLVESGERS